MKIHGSARRSGAQNSLAVRRRARNAMAPQRSNSTGQGGMAVRRGKKVRAQQKRKKAATIGQEGGANIPDGPSTIQELFNYPHAYTDLVLSSQHSTLLLHNIAQQHYNLRTHFSGIGTFEYACESFTFALAHHPQVCCPEGREPTSRNFVSFAEACDTDEFCRRVLSTYNVTAVYLAIQDRLPWALRQEVKQVPWPSKQLFDEDPIEAHRVAWKGILKIRELLSSCGSIACNRCCQRLSQWR